MSATSKRIFRSSIIIATVAALHLIGVFVADSYAGAFFVNDLGSRSLLRLLAKIMGFPLMTLGIRYMNGFWGFFIALTNSLLWGLFLFYLGQRLIKIFKFPSNI